VRMKTLWSQMPNLQQILSEHDDLNLTDCEAEVVASDILSELTSEFGNKIYIPDTEVEED